MGTFRCPRVRRRVRLWPGGFDRQVADVAIKGTSRFVWNPLRRGSWGGHVRCGFVRAGAGAKGRVVLGVAVGNKGVSRFVFVPRLGGEGFAEGDELADSEGVKTGVVELLAGDEIELAGGGGIATYKDGVGVEA